MENIGEVEAEGGNVGCFTIAWNAVTSAASVFCSGSAADTGESRRTGDLFDAALSPSLMTDEAWTSGCMSWPACCGVVALGLGVVEVDAGDVCVRGAGLVLW